jgi:hypothetical protein
MHIYSGRTDSFRVMHLGGIKLGGKNVGGGINPSRR